MKALEAPSEIVTDCSDRGGVERISGMLQILKGGRGGSTKARPILALFSSNYS